MVSVGFDCGPLRGRLSRKSTPISRLDAVPSLLGGCAMAAGPTLVGLGAPPLLGMGLLCVAAAGTWGVDGPL